MIRKPLLAAAVAATLSAAADARAQTPPSAEERAAYTGLLGVAASGAHNEIAQLLVNGLDPNVRDGHGRTPYLVAAHNGDIRAMEALARGGADTRAKDSRNYDAITILAVADRPEPCRPRSGSAATHGRSPAPMPNRADRRRPPRPPPGRRRADRRGRTAGPCEQPRLDGRHRVDRAGRRRCEPSRDAQVASRSRARIPTCRTGRAAAPWRWRWTGIRRDGDGSRCCVRKGGR